MVLCVIVCVVLLSTGTDVCLKPQDQNTYLCKMIIS